MKFNECSIVFVRLVLAGLVLPPAAATTARAQALSSVQVPATERQPPTPGPGGTALCGGLPSCYETLSFATRITDFQAILQNANSKTLTVRMSFRNKLSRPLLLGYVAGSGTATDDLGNRYTVGGDRAVQGIGLIQGNTGDPKFVLQPGEASDARFELNWNASRQEIFGLAFQLDLAIREIDPLPGNQIRLRREHALHFNGLSNRSGAAPATPRTTAAPPLVPPGAAVVSPVAAPPQVDPCGGNPRCYNAGPFAAEITGVTAFLASNMTSVHQVQAKVRLRNLTSQPLILGYMAGSASAVDDHGASYTLRDNVTYESVKGIGVVHRGKADPQFVLAPGASGDATVTLSRNRHGNDPIGAVFSLDLTIAHLEVLPGDQIRTVREYSVGFTALPASGGGFLNRFLQASPR